MSAWSIALIALKYCFELFALWLSVLFIIPFKMPIMLWVIVPIWINFIFTEIYQEKKGTSMGNAITNAVVLLWVGIDWIRILVESAVSGEFIWIQFLLKVIVCIVVIFFGLMITIQGIRGKKEIKIVARIKETTYITLVFTPLIYGAIDMTVQYIVSIIVFFPIFFAVFEALDRLIPHPKAVKEDEKDAAKEAGLDRFDIPLLDDERDRDVAKAPPPAPVFKGGGNPMPPPPQQQNPESQNNERNLF